MNNLLQISKKQETVNHGVNPVFLFVFKQRHKHSTDTLCTVYVSIMALVSFSDWSHTHHDTCEAYSDAIVCVPEGWSSHSLNVSQQSCNIGYCSDSCGCHWRNHWSHLEIEEQLEGEGNLIPLFMSTVGKRCDAGAEHVCFPVERFWVWILAQTFLQFFCRHSTHSPTFQNIQGQLNDSMAMFTLQVKSNYFAHMWHHFFHVMWTVDFHF